MIRKKPQQLSFAQLQVKNCINTAHWLHKLNDIINWAPVRKKRFFRHMSPNYALREQFGPEADFLLNTGSTVASVQQYFDDIYWNTAIQLNFRS